MFRGFDRAKYDVQDPSAWQAIARDKLLHEQNLLTVSRHLNAAAPKAPRAQIAKIFDAMDGPEHQILKTLQQSSMMKSPVGLLSHEKVSFILRQ